MRPAHLLLFLLAVPAAVAHGAEHSGPLAFEETPDLPFVAGRLILYVGMAASLGAAATLLLAPPAGHVRMFQVLAGGAAVQVLAVLLLARLEAGLEGATLEQGVPGLLVAVRVAVTSLLVPIGFAGWRGLAPHPVLARIALWVGIFLAWMQAALSHAEGRSTLALVLDWAHLVSAAAWLGGLGLFLLLLHHQHRGGGSWEQAAPFARRFSLFSLSAAALFIVTGTALAVLSLGTANLSRPGVLWDYPYSRFLLLKVAGVVGVVVLAAVNHATLHGLPSWLRGREPPNWLRRLSPGPGLALRRAASAEAVAGVVVLGLAALLVSSAPLPVGFDPLDYETFNQELAGDQHEGEVWIVPFPQAGKEQTMVFELRNTTSGAQVPADRVRFHVEGIDSGYNRSHPAERRGGPLVGDRDVFFPEPGRYVVEVEIRVGSDQWDWLTYGIRV